MASATTPTLPYAWYTDPGVAAAERRRIFGTTWQYVGHVGELQGAESMFPAHVAGVPIIVVRRGDGRLRGFLNICPHRGSIVLAEPACRGTIQCPYHAWTFDLDGSLRAAPRAVGDLDRDELGLTPIAIDTWGPFVLANLDAGAQPLAVTLGDLPDVVADHGLELDALRFHSRWHYEINANWKVALENYLECLHCRVNHPGLVSIIDEPRLRLEPIGMRASMFAPARDSDSSPLGSGGDLRIAQNHLLLPAMKFNVLPGHPNLSIGPLWPTGPETCSGFLDYFFGASVDEEWIKTLFEIDGTIGDEDTGLVESVQRGLRAGARSHGNLLVEAEALVAFFQRYVRLQLDVERGEIPAAGTLRSLDGPDEKPVAGLGAARSRS